MVTLIGARLAHNGYISAWGSLVALLPEMKNKNMKIFPWEEKHTVKIRHGNISLFNVTTSSTIQENTNVFLYSIAPIALAASETVSQFYQQIAQKH